MAQHNGKIEVELPTTMAFTVDENSDFTGATYTVDNKSGCDIDILVSQFTTKKSGITLKTKAEMQTGRDTFNRSNVSMALTGKVDGQPEAIDLAEVANGAVDRQITQSVLANKKQYHYQE